MTEWLRLPGNSGCYLVQQPAQAGPPRVRCQGSCPDEFSVSSRMVIALPDWATWASAWPPSEGAFSVYPSPLFLAPPSLHSLPLVFWVLLLAILEDRSDITLLQSLGTFPNHHDNLQHFKCSLEVTTASTHGCIPLGPMDLDVSNWFRYSLSWPCFKKDIFLRPFLFPQFLKAELESEDWGKEGIQSVPQLFPYLYHQFPFLIQL